MADALAELAAALLGNETQKAIAAENPYLQLQAVPDQVGQLTTQLVTQAEPGRFSAKEYLPWAIGSGLLSGFLSDQGNDYQNTLTGRYIQAATGNKPEGYLPSGLFSQASRQGGLFKMLNQLEDQSMFREAIKQNIVNSGKNSLDMQKSVLDALGKANTPKQAQQILRTARAMGIKIGDAGTETEAAAPVPMLPAAMPVQDDVGPELPLPTIQDIETGILKQKIDEMGIPPGEAQEAATKATNEIRQRNKALMGDELVALGKEIGDVEKIIREGEEGIGKAGKTGSGLASAYEKGLAFLDQYTGKFPEAREQAAGDKLLEKTRNIGAAINRIVGSGALSDFESRALFATAMSPTNTKGQNEALLKSYQNGLAVAKDYQSFMNYVLSKYGGDPNKAQLLWESYKKENPILVKRGKEYVVNESRTPWQKFNFTDAYKRMMSGEAPIAAAAETEAAATTPSAAEALAELKRRGKI